MFLTVTVPTSLTPWSSSGMWTSMSSVHAMNVPVSWEKSMDPSDDSMRTCSADSTEVLSSSILRQDSTLYPSSSLNPMSSVTMMLDVLVSDMRGRTATILSPSLTSFSMCLPRVILPMMPWPAP